MRSERLYWLAIRKRSSLKGKNPQLCQNLLLTETDVCIASQRNLTAGDIFRNGGGILVHHQLRLAECPLGSVMLLQEDCLTESRGERAPELLTLATSSFKGQRLRSSR